jgi:flagellar FliJ protein
MKRFRFRLESLLRYREYLAQLAQQEVARVRSEIFSCEERISKYEKDYAETARELDEEMSSGIDSRRYKHYTRYFEGIESSLEYETMNRKEMLDRLSGKQRQLEQRSVDKKILEKLKNRRREDYYKEALNTQQKETDDMIVLQKIRSMG